MSDVAEFVAATSAILISLIAIVVSLRANHIAHRAHQLNLRNKEDAERILLFEKKRALLNELDLQSTRFATLTMLTAQKILLFRDHPELSETMQSELDRLRSNLAGLQGQTDRHEKQRKELEATNVGCDIATREDLLANIRRLTIQVEKDIAHEQVTLEELRWRVRHS
jgi:hypothetical protein